jgi:hypothetical protein
LCGASNGGLDWSNKFVVAATGEERHYADKKQGQQDSCLSPLFFWSNKYDKSEQSGSGERQHAGDESPRLR